MKKFIPAAVVLAALMGLVVLCAQAPAFDAASLKPNKSADGGFGINIQPGGRFTATNVTLKQLIATAYAPAGPPLPEFQIAGGPDWIASEHFDIAAKGGSDLPGGPAAGQQMRLMLRTLLTERFHLTVHQETRDLPIYALVMVRGDGRIGPGLRKPEVDCAAAIVARGNAPPARGGPFCGIRGGPGRLMLSGVSMSTLAATLSRTVNRVVVDRTGLTGNFDGNLEWTPDQIAPAPAGGAPPGAVQPPPTDGPSIFTALQEQLGLKLDAQRGPVDVLVVERAERPTAD